MLLKLAWRNIWRNRRRSLITMASIIFAVLLSAFMESLQKGAWDNMINNVVSSYYGYVQIHEKGYWEEQVIDRAFLFEDSLWVDGGVVPVSVVSVPRLESFALGASDHRTRALLLIGTDPEREDAMTGLSSRIAEGHYLGEDESAVLLGIGLAERLDLEPNDTIVLISQGFRGVNAAGKYPVAGTIDLGSPDLNKMMAWMPIRDAQWFYGAEGRVTSIALDPGGQKAVPKLVATLTGQLDTAVYEIMDWKEMVPELLEAKALDSAGNIIVYIILYLIIAFGIYGTLLMMTRERAYEFGILLAIGMRRLALGLSVYLEVLLLGLGGALVGILVSLPLVWYFKIKPIRFSGDLAASLEKFGFEPIFPTILDARIFFLQAFIVFIITTVLAVYPLLKIARLRPVSAMRK